MIDKLFEDIPTNPRTLEAINDLGLDHTSDLYLSLLEETICMQKLMQPVLWGETTIPATDQNKTAILQLYPELGTTSRVPVQTEGDQSIINPLKLAINLQLVKGQNSRLITRLVNPGNVTNKPEEFSHTGSEIVTNHILSNLDFSQSSLADAIEAIAHKANCVHHETKKKEKAIKLGWFSTVATSLMSLLKQ